jgi:hypothetical protein
VRFAAANYAAFVWIPANKTILGGTGVAWGMHVWTADTQSAESRQQWRKRSTRWPRCTRSR